MQYFNIPNKILDYSLSSDSFKLLVYLYTRPPNWKVWNKKITNDIGLSSNKISKSWKELLNKKIVSRERERSSSGAIKGGGFIYKINCIHKNEDTGIPKNEDTVSDADIARAFELIWEDHRVYRSKWKDKHGVKSKAKERFYDVFKAIKKTYKSTENKDIFENIYKISVLHRQEQYTPYLENILDVDTILDKIAELSEE